MVNNKASHVSGREGDMFLLLFSFLRMIKKQAREKAPEACSFLHTKVLGFVKEEATPSMSEIANDLEIASPAVTSITEKLVESGDLKRVPDENDRRIIRLNITEKGKKTLEESSRAMKESIRIALAVLSDGEWKQLKDILEKLVRENKQSCSKQ